MFDIKFFSHIARNIYFYFYIFLALALIKSFSLSFPDFLVGLISAISSVFAVYFLNDYADKEEDKKFKKPSLYLSFKNKTFFWLITSFILIIGGFLSFINSINAFLFFVLFYIFNWFYSFLPLRLRDKSLLREINIFVIYLIKTLLVLAFLHYPLTQISISLLLIPGILAILALSIYKHYLRGLRKDTYIYFLIFLISLTIGASQYPSILILVLPAIPLLISIIYKRKIQLPINLLQFGYFVYSVFIYIIFIVNRG